MAQSSYHLPFVGSGLRSWDAWHAGDYGSAALQAGMFGIEVLGVRWAGQVRGMSKVGRQKITVRSLDAPNTLRGAKMSEVSRLIHKDWERMPLKKGKGVRYVNPANPGESI